MFQNYGIDSAFFPLPGIKKDCFIGQGYISSHKIWKTMRRYKADCDSIDGDWFVYTGIGMSILSTVYFLFFMSKWPYPLKPFLALAFSYFLGGWYVIHGHKYRKREIHTRKTYFLAGLGAYILWYALYVRATIYCNAGSAYHTGLAVLLILSLSFTLYSLAFEWNRFLWFRRE